MAELAETYQSNPQPATLQAEIERQGITMRAAFVPFSKSRSKGEKMPSLNWTVTIMKGDRELLTTDYMQGCGHCPSYKASIRELGGQHSMMRAGAIREECETRRRRLGGSIAAPNISDVIYSLVSDSDVLDYPTFEEWAGNFGYDTDSRKAESIYRACLEIALKLRNGLGEAGLAALRTAAQDF